MALRAEKVGSVVQKCLGSSLQKLELPFLTTIVHVTVTPDLKAAKVFLSIMPAGKENVDAVMSVIHKNYHDLQSEVNEALPIKNRPKLNFLVDMTEEKASHIEELIRKIHEEQDGPSV
jgi:ribosome-binding factor A